MNLTPNMRRLVKTVWTARPDGGGVWLEEIDLGMDERAMVDTWSILMRDPKLLDIPQGEAWSRGEGKHAVQLSKLGREVARQIVEEDADAERKRVASSQELELARVEKRRALQWKIAFAVTNGIWIVLAATVVPLIVSYYDRKIQKWEQQRVAPPEPVAPTTRP